MTPERLAEIKAWLADWDYNNSRNPINATIWNTDKTIDLAAALRELLDEIDRLKQHTPCVCG